MSGPRRPASSTAAVRLRGWTLRLLVALLLGGHHAPLVAHEVRPAYLQVDETLDHGYDILWKQPVMGEVALRLVPHLSSGWLEKRPDSMQQNSAFVLMRWKIEGPAPMSLAGQTLLVEGLENSITDVLVIVHSGGVTWKTVLTPTHASQRLDLSNTHPPLALPVFLKLGIGHILSGVDHLLFVMGLLLIVTDRWMLFKTITAFTLAHSITLALATFNYVNAPVALIDSEIALSILFLAPEALRRLRNGTSLTLRHPWCIAFVFGLLHGLGFASGLSEAGLPPGNIPAALLLFNLGVEIGQLAFVGSLLALAHASRALEIRWPRALQLAPAYLLGIAGTYWTIQRLVLLIHPQSVA